MAIFRTLQVEAPILAHLRAQEALLQQAQAHFRETAQTAPDEVSDAAEWLLDNYYVVRQAARQIREDLGRDERRRTPAVPAAERRPLLYALARDLISACDGRLQMEEIASELIAYQECAPLTMAEIWALPALLRLGLLTLLAQTTCRMADLQLQPQAPEDLDFPPPAADASDEEVGAHCIMSLHLLANQDWSDFFAAVSRVEQALNEDPAGIYARMEDTTREQYRRVVQELAWATDREEEEVAREALALARAQLPAAVRDDREPDPWRGLDLPPVAHVGYYLLAPGRQQLEERLAYRPSRRQRARRRWSPHLPHLYVGTILLLTGALAFAPAAYVLAQRGTPAQVLGAALLSVLPAMTLVVNLINWLVNLTVPPRRLPKLDFRKGIPARCQTVVAIPALITGAEEVADLLRQVELHYLSNANPNLQFALLTDFANGPRQEMPGDEALLARLKEGIRRLNEEHDGPFYLFHRRRRWNPGEGAWMGWECKRGKLMEFNRLLRGGSGTSYTTQIGDVQALQAAKYVITLDVDTLLPRDSAHCLVATLAHPLNRPQCDPRRGAVIDGHAVLQPRIEIWPESAGRSWFAHIFSQAGGLDLYQRAVSDVYHDLFGQGIYAGKGIYDVDAFNCALAGRVPENSLLSHDLFEGIYGRAGLVTDVVLYEDHPPHYLAYARRLHRWMRGDWQMLPWLLRRMPRGNGQKAANDLPLLDRWKIWDNLRRSLLAPALLAFLVVAWLWLPGPALLWTASALLTLIVPHVTSLLVALRRPASSWATVARPFRWEALRWLLSVVFLPYEALLALDAIWRTLVRLTVTRRGLLQWPTAADTVRQLGRQSSGFQHWRQMAGAPLLALGTLAALAGSPALPTLAPLLLAWLLSPSVAHLIDRQIVREHPSLSASERQQLRRLARRTWLFFERFAGPEDNWLPPDHFQESPQGTVAHRTSPTNIGLYLLSALAAYDLGHLDPLELVRRLRSALDAMDSMERYRGHFLNWIDTRTLSPVRPRYVSTVDSGNLAACLLALGQGCRSLPRQPLWRWQQWQGYLDALALLRETLAAAGVTGTGITGHLQEIEAQVLVLCDAPQAAVVAWPALLERLARKEQAELERRLLQLVEEQTENTDTGLLRSLRLDGEQARYHLNSMQRLADHLLPWLRHLQQAPALFRRPGAPPTLRAAWDSLLEALPLQPSLVEVPGVCVKAESALQGLQEQLAEQGSSPALAEARDWCRRLGVDLRRAAHNAQSLHQAYGEVQEQLQSFVAYMDFSFLFDRQRQVFHVGYDVDAGQLDFPAYDFLASEARVASLIAIAKNDVPQKHWLRLARPATCIDERQALLSWSGTLFEYLMPALWFRHPRGSLLHESCRAAIRHQIAHARQRDLPWGISESGFYALDADMKYHYRAFGVPGLGFKPGQAGERVVAPYASLLALSLAPREVLQNLQELHRLGALGPYGLYEALDFTPDRLPPGQEVALVRSYMAHHQGMILLSLANSLNGKTMVDRLHAEPRIRTVELLLHERALLQAPAAGPPEEALSGDLLAVRPDVASPWQVPPASSIPLVHLLSNGCYHSRVTNAAGGHSRWQEVAFYPHMAAFMRRHDDLTLRMEVTVAPADDVEIRRLRLSNDGDQPRLLRLAGYGELALREAGHDRRYPASGKAVVECEYLATRNALLFWRRPASDGEQPPFLAHTLLVEEGMAVTGALGTDRERLLGQEVEIAPQATVHLALLTATATSRSDVLALLDRYPAMNAVEGAFAEAMTYAGRELQALELTVDDLQHFQPLLSLLLSPQRILRPTGAMPAPNRQRKRQLQRFAISGDHPILLLLLHNAEELTLLRHLLQAHAYWQGRGQKVDLVAVAAPQEDEETPLPALMEHLACHSGHGACLGRAGGVHLLHRQQLDEEDFLLLQTAARVVLDGSRGSLARQLAPLLRQVA